MKVYFVVNARMPNEKAHGIHIAKMCEAFVISGIDLTLVVPSRGLGDIQQAYGLTQTIRTKRLPIVNMQFLGSLGYGITALQFIIGTFLYLWAKILSGERFVIYTVDMDQFSFVPLAVLPRPVFSEMHSIKKSGFLAKYFFKRADIIATNQLIADGLITTFSLRSEQLLVEPNGVDEIILQNKISQEEARVKLGIPPSDPFALYVGRFYSWKGLEILADAVQYSSLPLYVVGGTKEEYERVTKKSGEGLHFVGARPVGEISLWLAAADVLLVLGTAQNEDSYRYTSPMKIFEYFASSRPVVSSRTPAVVSIVKEGSVFWYDPDNAHSLAEAIREAHTSSEIENRVTAGYMLAGEHTWRRRAERIMRFMDSKITT